ncbi:hypothetical protein SCAR479_10706 [Seiridium cardinale]|uniref:Zn(2)-C6 fungal-type domain-containing protein n=1 Tax=Seiridium cardinale TaxID=138064 RepID=A0ABR2XG61_9PEZI
MVGVKGKYKGCNTCRKRRVACDNTRPFCKKCTDHGRECEGYHTETVFIVGTLEDKGRCASHPPRNLQSSLSSSSSKKKAADVDSFSPSPEPAKSRRRAASEGQQNDTNLEFTEVSPVRMSWEECVNVASVGGLHKLRFAAIHTKLRNVRRQHERLGDWETKLSFSTSSRVDVTPAFTEDEFKLEAECFVFLPRSGRRSTHGQGSEDEEGVCLFLYEQNASAAYSNKPPWKDPAILSNPVRQRGPEAFKAFPEHHFFTRVYRPNAIFAALLNHNPTPLADPEWLTVPWEYSPKTALDNLLDIVSQLPSLLSRADRVLPLPPSISRRLKANDIISNCAAVEAQIEAWYTCIEEAAARNRENPLLYWPWQRDMVIASTGQWEQGQVPFQVTYEFPTAEGGLAHIYYWTALIMLYGITARLAEVVAPDASAVGSSTTIPTAAHPLSPGSMPSSTAYIQPQRYSYGSPNHPAHSFGSMPTFNEGLSAPSTTDSLPYYQTSSSSPYHTSASPQIDNPASGSRGIPLGIDPAKYGPREIRKLAANVCRSLDWAIGRSESKGPGPTSQPDLVAAPLHIVESFYESIKTSGDGELERLWCRSFRQRWERRGREIESMVLELKDGSQSGPADSNARLGMNTGARSWIELGKFGG